MFLVNFPHLLWMLVDRPFDNVFTNFVEIYADFIINVLNFSFFIFISAYESERYLGFSIIFMVITAMFAYLLLIFRNGL